MVITLSDYNSAGAAGAVQVANFATYTNFYAQVIGPGTMRIAESQNELLSPAPPTPANPGSGPLDGLQLNQNDGVQAFRWKGPLWAIGSGPGVPLVVFVILPSE